MIKTKFLAASICVLCIGTLVSPAQANTIAIGAVQNTMGGVVRKNLISRGYQPADPRFRSTFGALTNTFTDWAAQATLIVGSVVSAPAWLTGAALCLGIPLAKEAGEYLGLAYARWEWDRNHKDDVTIKAAGKLPITPPMVKGGAYAYYTNEGERLEGSDAQQLARAALSLKAGKYQTYACTTSGRYMTCGVLKWNNNHGRFEHDFTMTIQLGNDAPNECGPSSYWTKTGCATLPLEYPDGVDPNGVTKPFNDAVRSLTTQDLARPLNPSLIAGALNTAWQQAAAKPGYDGIPYDYAHPITATDVESWALENDYTLPTVGDWVTPADPASKPWTIPNINAPGTSYDPATDAVGTNPAATQPQVNLGNDPAIPFPQLEEIPTAEMILKPILSLMPDLKNFSAPIAGGSCPTPSFTAFERSFRFEKHCEVAEQNRGAIKAAMLALFALASLLTVLRA